MAGSDALSGENLWSDRDTFRLEGAIQKVAVTVRSGLVRGLQFAYGGNWAPAMGDMENGDTYLLALEQGDAIKEIFGMLL